MGEKELRTYLSEAREKTRSEQSLVQGSVAMARELNAPALSRLHAEERSFLAALSRLVADASSRRFVEDLCEYVFRNAVDPADQLRRLLTEFGGVPTFFSTMGRLRIKAATMASRGMPQAFVMEVLRVFRSTFGEHVLPASVSKVSRRAEALAKDGVRLLLRPLAPPVYGADGAQKYAAELEKLLVDQAKCGVVVEPLRLCPGISPCSPEQSANELAKQLRRIILSAAGKPLVVETHCSDTMAIIVEALKLALKPEEVDQADIALMLPGYLRSSVAVLRDLADWASVRAAREAKPLKVLLVKGNYLEEERRRAALYGTESQLCATKSEADACFARLFTAAMHYSPKVITPVVGTHELTHLCYAALRWARSGREGVLPVCLLYGLGNHVARQFARMGAPAMLCAPVAPAEDDSLAAEVYLLHLVRELSRKEGWLAEGYSGEATNSDKARALMAAISSGDEPSRVEPVGAGRFVPGHLGSLLERAYVDAFYEAAQEEKERRQEDLPLRIAGEACESPLMVIHRSLTVTGLVDYRFMSADYAAVEKALQHAQAAAGESRASEEERAAALRRASRELRRRSTEFAALLVRDVGCTLHDAQVELRDAIDGMLYYAADAWRGSFSDGAAPQPLGVVVVTAGVAHPLAEAAAGISAAWVAGNSVIYKPAAYSTLLGLRFAELLAEAGVALLCLPVVDNEISLRLMRDSRVAALIGSGGPELLRKVMGCVPACTALLTPAVGSSVYLSEHADWRAALPEIVEAVYRRSGQSPTSPHTLIVHERVYNSSDFVVSLGDAVSSLRAQPAWREGADLGPLATPLSKAERVLIEQSGKDESAWPLPLRGEGKSELLLQPGICLEAAPGSEFSRHGLRLPAMGIVVVPSAEEGLEVQSSLAGGECAILYTKDADEIALWRNTPHWRSLAINCCPATRPGVVPAPTLRSARLGARAPMAGGPNYAAALCCWQEQGRPTKRSTRRSLVFDPKSMLPATSGAEETMRLSAAADSISYWWEQEFSSPRELSALPGFSSQLEYCPLTLCLRVEKAMPDADVGIALMAAMQAGCSVQLSLEAPRSWVALFAEQHGVSLSVESRADYEAAFPTLASLGAVVRDPAAPESTLAAAAAAGVPINTASVLANGRLELLNCLGERLLMQRTEA